jgi:predicted glycogen debranching enzyme
MDARVAGHPVSSRWGLAVELQALWSKGCDDLSWLADRFGDTALATKAALARDAARQSFSRRFWCEQTNYPYDVMSASEEPHAAWSDASVRPNALVALSIDPSLFTHDQARSIIERVERDLLTEMGIRTLSPYEPGYRGTYTGGIEDRDRAYHQGTAWPFLFGALSRAIRHTFPDDADRKDRMRALLESALSKQVAVGQVPEVADGDPPHRPDGCVAYAASVAEMLRSLVDDLGL